MFKQLSKQAKKQEDGQGLVEYALILVLVAVVVIVVLLQMGPAVGNVFSEIVDVLGADGIVASAEDSPQEGDTCVDYNNDGYQGTPWHYIWRYQSGSWGRIADPGGALPTCSFSEPGANGSR